MDSSLKQRLVGATVLVALAVIFLPMLVKGPAPDSGVSDVAIDVPAEPKDADGMVTQDLPLVGLEGTPANGATGMPTTLPAAAVPPQAPQDGSQPAVAAGDYAVGFGSYATAADADKVIAALKGAGLASYRETVTLAGRKAERVRIGPFADRAQAESARLRAGQVNAAVDAKVVVLDADASAAAPAAAAPAAAVASAPVAAPVAAPVKQEPLPPPAPKPAPGVTPPKPAVAVTTDTKKPEPKVETAPKPEPPVAKPADTSKTGYAVQLGAFSSGGEATKLRDRLRAAGFNAFTDTVPTDKGTLTRVRVGPAMTRAEADTLKSSVQAKVGISGMVRPHP